jgi:hypothetical protein
MELYAKDMNQKENLHKYVPILEMFNIIIEI